ncbi:Gfo/Idh/MocA family protein [Pseudoduganella umbonata]|uniref:Gfo/Idh/MocA family oxidoreductase n=1 Tax=Pseudoduganella umbonata TaxID=864828 RepID=A0A4P8HWE4_9BURK|nr:Gfo/Idh/MocA family oxidoreductase [Pseudoduganella umbonata]MBB3221839.1 putative dehydrogenase [Pseudoduganella umbonata]QCP14353.1 Gfo/Idh/MocA family oxidoreductase [Pseudoduganella umbonata]
MNRDQPPRRDFLRYVGTLAALSTPALHAGASEKDKVEFPPIYDKSEKPEKTEPPADPWNERVGIALVGLGRITVNEMLPALAQCRHAKPVALVTGDRAKGLKIAHQYNIPESAVLDYKDYDRLAQMPDVQGVYLGLPNHMHLEYTVRAARAGKHVLCEKPMANSVAECRQMIDACRKAGRKLMIAYRSQYEPMDRALAGMVREKKLGALKEFVSVNSQNMGDPQHWRLKRALAGGGALPDIGLYCINAARFLSGEEPNEVIGNIWSTPGDARFREVEESCQFILRFPSGFIASCSTSYAAHKSQHFRLNGAQGWAEMNPAYAYRGLKLTVSRVVDGKEQATDIQVEEKNQFALEMDHFAQCIQQDREVHTPGEEGLQDQRIMEAIYESARTRRAVKLTPPGRTRGPEPQQEAG